MPPTIPDAPKHLELLQAAPEQLAEIEQERGDEIVALVCVLKPEMDTESAAVKIAIAKTIMHIQKNGQKPQRMKPNVFLPMKRSDAEWHVAKASRNDLTNPLMLVIKPLDEAKNGKKGGVAAMTYRDKLIAQALSEKLITEESQALNVNDEELAGLLRNAPKK